MFDSKKEPQDIFEGVEPPANLPVGGASVPSAPASSPAPSMPRPVVNPAPGMPSAPRPTMAAPAPVTEGKIINDRYTNTGGHLMKTIVIVVIAFLAMGGAAFLAYKYMSPVKDSANVDSGTTAGSNDESDLPDGKGSGSDVVVGEVPDVVIVLDTDGDGLTNDEEKAAGTNVAKPDTDGDLLGDREEVQVYGTDPLRVDTDGDTFGDGEEVRAWYNPNGPGKILELPTE